MPGFGNVPPQRDSVAGSHCSPMAAAGHAAPGAEQCHAAREDVTRAAGSRSRKAQILQQERGAKPPPHPSRGSKPRQPHVFHLTARSQSPVDKQKEIRSHQERVPQAGKKRTTGDPPAGDEKLSKGVNQSKRPSQLPTQGLPG